MNLKTTIGGILLAGGLLANGTASAATFFNSSLAAWAAAGTIVDAGGDADSSFTYIGNSANLAALDGGNGLAHIGVTWSETAVGPIVRYSGALNFTGLGAGGLRAGTYSVEYAVNFGFDIGDGAYELLSRVALFSSNNGFANTTVTKQVYADAAHTIPLTSLTSINGSTPAAADFPTGVIQHFYVVDTFSVDATGNLAFTTNNYDVRLPEPVSLSLFGIGLAGMAFARRRLA